MLTIIIDDLNLELSKHIEDALWQLVFANALPR